ncbi:MAG TPA: hypothetical protein VF210_18525 [Pseudomonadales bacterium]
MTKLLIEDLPEDAELDAEAMKAVTGGRPIGRNAELRLERRFRSAARMEESPLVRGLIRTGRLGRIEPR